MEKETIILDPYCKNCGSGFCKGECKTGNEMETKSNKLIRIEKDSQKSYVYICDGIKNVGTLLWHYQDKKWVFDDEQI